MRTCALLCVFSQESFLSFHLVGSGKGTEVASLGSRHGNLLITSLACYYLLVLLFTFVWDEVFCVLGCSLSYWVTLISGTPAFTFPVLGLTGVPPHPLPATLIIETNTLGARHKLCRLNCTSPCMPGKFSANWVVSPALLPVFNPSDNSCHPELPWNPFLQHIKDTVLSEWFLRLPVDYMYLLTAADSLAYVLKFFNILNKIFSKLRQKCSFGH